MLLLFSAKGFAFREMIDIGIFWDARPASVVVSVASGTYELYGDGSIIESFTNSESIQINVSGNKVGLKLSGKDYGQFSEIFLKRKKWGSSFHIKPIIPNSGRRIYDDNLQIAVLFGKLKIINNVYLEHYVAGVVESESGPNQGLEYYKVQAIICRTYALKYLNKYANMGFDLCDRVNSQVYHSKSTKNQLITEAVNQTKGLVVVDSDINLIQAVFHSNSGGITANSEDVWTQAAPYLRSVVDTFSFQKRHSEWTFHTTKESWLKYLKDKYNYPVEDEAYVDFVLNYCPPYRDRIFTPLAPEIKLTEIRKDWKFKSAYFDIFEQDGYVYFNGYGYGHGVGLSQEGAMRMIEMGYTFQEVLKHYYSGIHIVHLSALNFFRSE